MKRVLYILVLFIFIAGLTGCFNKKVTLKDIAEKINNSETAKSYKDYGYEIKATVNGNELVITTKMADENSSVTYKLEGNILSNEKISYENVMTALLIVDSVGQAQGYKDGELAENLNAFPDEVSKYTVEKEGFEFKQTEYDYSLKIDISKKIPLIDMSNLYLKTDEFSMIKDIVAEKTNGNQSGKVAKIAYDVFVGDEESTITIGEREKLTTSAYKSILSALEVMYGTKAVDYFKEKYPEFKEGKTTIDGITIDTNHQVENKDETVFKDTKVVLVTINNKALKNIL